METRGSDPPGKLPWVRRLLGQFRWAVLLTYLVLLGGTPVGELNGWVQAANGSLALSLIVVWLRRARRETDRLDIAIIVALLLFLTTAVLSVVPRQSFAAAIQATALAAGFYLARRGPSRQGDGSVLTILGWICVFVVGVTLAAWVGIWISWLQGTGWSQGPPLSIPLPGGAFGNRHYVGTLVLLLAPALWGAAFRQRWPFVAYAGSVGGAGVVLMDASRTIVAAAIVASLTVAAMHARPLITRLRGGVGWLVFGATALLVIAAVGAAPLILERLTNLSKLLVRFTLWDNAIDVWRGHPVAGVGPGVYPFSYFMTDYFADLNYAPRHPDNAAAQLMVEAGILGIAAATITVTAILLHARRRWHSNPAAIWALTAFLVACVGTNPTDFLFLLVPALIWAAILAPAGHRTSGQDPVPRRSEAWNRLLTVAIVPVAIAVLLTSVGSVGYQLARGQYRSGDIVGATRMLRIAAAVDPGQALYWREWGTLLVASGNPKGGRRAFERALWLVPWEPGAIRGLALADLAIGDPRAALADAQAALRVRPHTVASAIIVAAAALEADAPNISAAAMSSVLLDAPYLGFVPWSDTVLSHVNMRVALAAAGQIAGDHRGGGTTIGPVLVVLMAGAGDATAAAGSTGTHSARALAAIAQCDEAAAEREIQLAGNLEREDASYWFALAVVSRTFPRLDIPGSDMASRYLGLHGSPGPLTTSLISEVEDEWRYRRPSLEVSGPLTSMPGISRGQWLLVNDPAGAMSGVTRWPPTCQGAVTQ